MFSNVFKILAVCSDYVTLTLVWISCWVYSEVRWYYWLAKSRSGWAMLLCCNYTLFIVHREIILTGNDNVSGAWVSPVITRGTMRFPFQLTCDHTKWIQAYAHEFALTGCIGFSCFFTDCNDIIFLGNNKTVYLFAGIDQRTFSHLWITHLDTHTSIMVMLP